MTKEEYQTWQDGSQRPNNLFEICIIGYYTMQKNGKGELPDLMDYVYRMIGNPEEQVRLLYEWYYDSLAYLGYPDFQEEERVMIIEDGFIKEIRYGKEVPQASFTEMLEYLHNFAFMAYMEIIGRGYDGYYE